MAIITSSSPNPYYLIDVENAAENASNIVVYTGSTGQTGTGHIVDPVIEGSGMSAALKIVAAGINRDISWDSSFTLTNLHVTGNVYGGLIVSSNTNTALPVAASQVAQKYYVGSTPSTIRQAVLTGNTSVTIENGSYTNVFGGGAGYGSKVTGDTEINWKGNSVNNIYGGGDIGSVVEGDTNVNIIGNSTGNAYYGYYSYGGRISKVYGGGKNSIVKGDSNVTFSSDAALINFTGTVYGSGEGKNSIVKGSRNLVFDNYSNDFKATIVDFTNISFEGASSVTMTRAQNKSVIGATYEFDINDDSLKNIKAMLVWNMNNVRLNNVVVTIGTSTESVEPQMLDQGATIDLISSKYFVNDSSFNTNNVLVLNDEGNRISKFLYTLSYQKYDKKTKEGGLVSINYKGTANLMVDGSETEKVVLTGRNDEVNLTAGGNLVYGLETAGGDDTVNVQVGAVINGTISLGAGDDTLCIQVGATLNGCIDLGSGDDHMVLAAGAVVNCDVALGAGKNDLTVQNHAMITGTVRFADGSDNTVIINGGAISSFAGGDAETNNTLVVNGSRLILPILGAVYSGGIGYFQNILPNSIDISGIVGTVPVDLGLTIDDENWILANLFVAQDLNLGDSNDTVTFNSYAQVMNINLGAGDDKLTLNEEAIIGGDINLGSGDNVLVINCGNVFDGRLIENLDGTVVVVAGANMELDGDKLGFGSTNNVLVVTKGAQVEVEGGSMGRFLNSENDDVYLCQNAVVRFEDFSHHTEYIQSYTGYLTVDGDLHVWAESDTIPDQVAPYYKITTPGGVVNAELSVDDNFVLDSGANLTNSTVEVGEDAVLSGTVAGSSLLVEGDAFIDGTVTSAIVGGVTMDSYLDVDGNVHVDGTVSNSIIEVGGYGMYGVYSEADSILHWNRGNIYIDGTVTDSVINASRHADIDGTVINTVLTAREVEFDENASFTGSIMAHEVKFNYTFTSSLLAITAGEIKLEEDIVVTIASLSNGDDEIDYDFEDNSSLIETDKNLITIGDTSNEIFFTDGFNVSIRGVVTGDMSLSNNRVTLDDDGYFVGKAFLSGANILVVNDSDWYDWQQFVFAPEATLGFEIADYVFFAIDGYIGDQQTILTLVVDNTTLGQNSQLAIGSWIYIKDWNDGDVRPYTLPPDDFSSDITDGVPSLSLENLYVMAGAEIWGGIKLDDHDNELVINDGVVINGGRYYYDYATIQTLGGDDTVTIGAATINGQIDTGITMSQGSSGGAGDDDMLTLNGTILNAAVNQGVPVITMGWGNDDLSILGGSVVTGDISLGDGHDDAFISASTVNGSIDLGEGYNDLAVISSTVGTVADSISDDAIVGGSAGDDVLISASTVNGDIELGDGNNELAIVAGSTLNGNIELGSDDDEVEIEASIVNGNIDLGEGDNELDIVASTVGVEVTADAFGHRGSDDAIMAGDDDDDVYISASTVNGDIELGDGDNDLDIFNGSIVNGDIELGDNYDSVKIKDSTVNGSIDLGGATGVDELGYGAHEPENELAVINSTVGVEMLPAAYGGRVSDDAIVAGDDADDIYISGSTVNGDIELGDGENDLDIKAGSVVTGDIKLGDDINTLDIGASIVTGDIELGDGFNQVILTDSTVDGNISYGTEDNYQSRTEQIIVPVMPGINTLYADNSTITKNVYMSGLANVVQVNNSLTINGYVEPLAARGEDEPQVGGLFMHAVEWGNVIALDEVASITLAAVDAKDYEIGGPQDITMIGEANAIATHDLGGFTLGSGVGDEVTVDEISNQITANALNMIAVGATLSQDIYNKISFGVGVEVDGRYSSDPYQIQPGLHKISKLNLGAVGMTLNADIAMIAGGITGIGPEVPAGITGYNLIDMDYWLNADGEGDIVVNGDANISIIGDIAMIGFENELTASIDFEAINQGKIDVGDHNVSLLIDGNITMFSADVDVEFMLAKQEEGISGTNEILLGYNDYDGVKANTAPIDPGEIIANGEYTVTVDGSILMGGIGVINTLDIYKNVTVNGNIIMGFANGGPMNDTTMTGDDLAALNTLTVWDPGTFTIDGSIVLTARENDVYFYGDGDVTGLVSIYGGSNSLYVAEGVTINDIVSFGGVYDADHIGVEGYLIQANTHNEIDIYGTVRGIDTSIDLAGPTGTVNASNDDIEIYGTVTEGITTGNGNDDIDIIGGHVDGNIVMGDRASGASGSNDLYIEAVLPEKTLVSATLLGGAATVDGDVIMETTTTNRLTMKGEVVTDFSEMLIPEAVYRASINGNVLMNAIDGITGGTNTVLLGDGFHESATTIVGDVTMNAGAGNTMTVDTGWLYEFDMDGSHDAASYVNSIGMSTEVDNTLEVEHGTFVIGFTGADDGIIMRQDLFKEGVTGGNNLIDVDEEARLVMTSDVRMGNTVDEILVNGAYDFLNVTITGNIETYHFVWSGDVSGTLFDTVENKIDVDGKMFAGNIVMTASDNYIFLTGPAEVPWTVDAAVSALDAHGPTGTTGAIMDVDDIIMNGWTNTIGVEGHSGSAFFDSGDILMSWGAGLTAGTSIDAKTNMITNDENGETLFHSGGIQMYASNANTLELFGMLDADGVVTKSTVTGGVTMATTALAGVTTDTGFNYAGLYDADVTGNVSLMAGGGVSGLNVLNLIGSSRGASGTIFTESNITGNVVMTTDVDATGATFAGDNIALISLGNVGGNVIMTALGTTGDNVLNVGGAALEGVTYTSDIGGGIDMDSNAGCNSLGLFSATAGDISPLGITMDAGNWNYAKITASTVNGSVSQTAGTWNYLGIDPSTVTGNVTMTSVLGGDIIGVGDTMTGGNFLEVSGATAGSTLTSINVIQSGIGGNVVMDANLAGSTAAYGYNYADIDMAGITGSLSMTSVYGLTGGNHLDLDGGIGSVGVTGTIVESNIGGLNMTSSGVTAGATGGDNIAHINLSNVNGNVVMTASGIDADNILEVVGGVNEFGVTYTSDISGGILMDSDAGVNYIGMTMATVGGGITMDTSSYNIAEINSSTVNGSIYQEGILNDLYIDPSTVTGDVTMKAGIGWPSYWANYLELKGATVVNGANTDVIQSKIGGNVVIEANLGGNTGAAAVNGAFINMGGITGSVSMTSYGEDGGNVFGLTGGTGAVGATGTIVESYIGSLTMISSGLTSGATGGDNVIEGIKYADVHGDIIMNASGINADNTMNVAGGVDGAGVTFTSDISGGIEMVSGAGNNTMNLEAATVGAGITMIATLGTNSAIIQDSGITGDITQSGLMNTLMIDPSTVSGDVSMTAVLQNALTIIGAGVTGPESSIGGNVNMIVSGSSGTNNAVINYSDVSGSVNMDATGTTLGFNILSALGSIFDASDIGGGIDMTNASIGFNHLTLNMVNVGAGITMTTLGTNAANIVDSGITGGIYQSGSINTLTIDPSTINGNIGMTAGISNVSEIEDSTVNGNVTMFATTGGNTFEFGGGISHEGSGLGGTQSFANGDVSMTAGISGATGADNAMLQFGDVTGSISMETSAGGDNALWITGRLYGGVTLTSDVTGGVNMTTSGTGNNTLDLREYSSIGGGVIMMSGASGSSIISVDSTSGITGDIVTGDGNDYLNIGGSVTGDISTGLGDDDLDVFAGATITGTIDMGAGNNDIDLGGVATGYVAGITFMFSDINTGKATGTVDISGSDNPGEVLLITDNFGTSGSTMTVKSTVDTLLFNEAGTIVAGNLDTANGSEGMTGTVNVFDASALAVGTTLITTEKGTSWDILDNGGAAGEIEIIGNAGFTGGDSVILVENYAVDLEDWYAAGGGITEISLTSGSVTGTLNWVTDHYEGTVNDQYWQLSDGGKENILKLSVAPTNP